jgi:hypothetical protein
MFCLPVGLRGVTVVAVEDESADAVVRAHRASNHTGGPCRRVASKALPASLRPTPLATPSVFH